MNHSLLSADRNTHLKIVVVALLAAILVVGVGIQTRLTTSAIARHETGPALVKAGKPTIYTRSEAGTIR